MKLPAHLASLLLVFSALSHAADADIHFGGFGTLGIAHSDNPHADYRADQPFAAKGPGRSVDWDAGLDSKPALGRMPKLTDRQIQTVLGWFTKSPRAFGYSTELWTSRRVRPGSPTTTRVA